jgi:hypothetical protein
MPRIKEITISGIKPNGDLILPDNGITEVDKGDKVIWIIGSGSGVKKIDKIVKSGGDEVFSNKPSKKLFSKKWVGTISNTVRYGAEQKYDIHYTPEGSNEIMVYDPKIIVNSRK